MKLFTFTTLLVSLFILTSCQNNTPSVSTNETPLPVGQEENITKDDTMVEESMMKKEGEWTKEEMEAMKKDDMMQKTSSTKEEEMGESNEQQTKEGKMEESAMKSEPTKTVEKQGVYTAYSPNLVGKTKNTVLFFHASWCPSCRAADATILKETIPEGLSILKIDYDNSAELKKKYEVLSQHTFVEVDAKGNLISKWAGGTHVSDIIENLK